jgi:hypothetical protein
MSILSYRCPNTSKEIETSIDTEPAALVKMGNLKVGVVCPYCPGGHVVTADSMFFCAELETSSGAR